MPENVNISALVRSDDSSPIVKSDERQSMIKIDHVSMIFNMASEQLNSLKEYAVKIVRRELFFEGFTALDDVSFEVKKGDVFGIIGTNGSGKSTMLKIIAGVLEPTKGTCEISGNIAPLIELGAGFDTELSARENIYLNGALLGYSKEFINDHFNEIVEFAEIEKFLDMPLKNYSSGMVARIAFAIATVIVPEILVVDEVLSVGDFMFQKKCEDRINELIEKHGVTVLIVSHSNSQIERLCNKVIWIEKGHTRMIGDSASVCRVYGGLGGRMGSPKAEQRVFDALQKGKKHDSGEFDILSGDDANGTAVQLASNGWKEGFDTAIVVGATTHINAVMASGLAGSLDAPILPTKPDRLPDVVTATLHAAKPSTIYFIDCENHAATPLVALKNLPWSPTVIEFINDGNAFELSSKLERYGAEQNIWSDSLMIVDFDDNPESLTATPLASNMKCPVIVTRDETPCSKLADIVCRGAYKHTFIVGNTTTTSIDSHLQELNLHVERIARESPQETCIALSKRTLDYIQNNYGVAGELYAAALSLSQWPELLAIGSYAARMHGALLLENPSDLDDISACLDFLEHQGSTSSQLSFIGKESGLTPLDRELLLEAFEEAHTNSASKQKDDRK